MSDPRSDAPRRIAATYWYVEWRYWLVGLGGRTEMQSLVGYRFTLYFGPLRFSFWRFE